MPWDAIRCTNPMCNDIANRCSLIELFPYLAIDKYVTSSKLCIPYTCNKYDLKSNIAGRSDLVKPHREALMIWNSTWW